MSLFKELILAGIPLKEMDNHCSDLYIKKTFFTDLIIEGYKFKNQIKPFEHEQTKETWLDIPFAFDNYKKDTKTMKMWNEDKRELGKFLEVGDIVDDDIAEYFIGVLPPRMNTGTYIQIGEAYDSFNGYARYSTLEWSRWGWIYIGLKKGGMSNTIA